MINRYKYTVPKEAIGTTLIELAKNNEKICVFSSDVSKSVNVYEFSQEFPNRFFEMGIAEQSSVSAAGGMAIEGFIPVYVALAIFSNGMTFPQTRQEHIQALMMVRTVQDIMQQKTWQLVE